MNSNFNSSLKVHALASSYPYTISNGDGGKYPKQISKTDLLVEVCPILF
jgi:hypothetical protein